MKQKIKSPRIVYQGMPGAYSHIVSNHHYGSDTACIGKETFRDLFELLMQDEADIAMVPIENSLVGSIYENYDLIESYGTHVIGEHIARIDHALLATGVHGSNAGLSNIRTVLSHPKALEQCSGFIRKHPWMKAEVFVDTAAAAHYVAAKKDPSLAAIASRYAGELYGLNVAADSIQDTLKNYTRFLSVSKNPEHDPSANKCSLSFRLRHVPGSLAAILAPFAQAGASLTKIESRPIPSNPFEYRFYLDFECCRGGLQEIEIIVQKVKQYAMSMRIIGIYKAKNHAT